MITGYRDATPASLPNAGTGVQVPIFSGLPYWTLDSVSGFGPWRPMRYPGPAPMISGRRLAHPHLPPMILGQSALSQRTHGQPHPPLTHRQAAWLYGVAQGQQPRVGILGYFPQSGAAASSSGGTAPTAARPGPPGGPGRLSTFFLNLFQGGGGTRP